MINVGKKVLVLTLAFLFLMGGMSLAQDLPREETLVVTGAMWGPPSTWNVLIPNPTPGTGGLVYEPLFSYNPVKDEFTPWLAESGEWVSDNEYLLELREDISWSDGEAFNAEDVVFTYQLAADNDIFYSPIWEWMESVEAEGSHTVKFTFSEPHYAEWNTE